MIDFHCHSAFSDGTDSPEELVRLAEAAGLTALALTDHDTVDGLDRFLGMQSHTSLRLVAGVELSCRFLGRELHLLGLFIDPTNERLLERLRELRHRRDRRNQSMAERLRELGRPVDLQRMRARAPGGLLTRTHFAQALVEGGSVQNPREAFHRFLADGAPGHVPMEELSPDEGIAWIKEAQGVPVLAHPGRFAGGAFVWDAALADLRSRGLEGIEAYYGEHSAIQERTFLELARQEDLAPSGGSDYHGGAKPGLRLGRGWGSLCVPDALVDGLEARRPSGSRL